MMHVLRNGIWVPRELAEAEYRVRPSREQFKRLGSGENPLLRLIRENGWVAMEPPPFVQFFEDNSHRPILTDWLQHSPVTESTVEDYL